MKEFRSSPFVPKKITVGESYNSVLIERLYEAGGNVMLDLIILSEQRALYA